MNRFTVERRFLEKYGYRWCLILNDEVIEHFRYQTDAALCAWQKNASEARSAQPEVVYEGRAKSKLSITAALSRMVKQDIPKPAEGEIRDILYPA